ncbi:dolichyl pyrophosphate glc1man9glcnac2 alpha-13-glucosyltransferase-related [Anaeramoeba flamelloides]|uniref:Alpha-1,3-glucosyltransferase n=1 Tax=Anaeramoeba flamelloides TaxID=1746091 RepID=A0AAV7ZPM5_9EUKA|nr:dolichyl pyrophosphate glc1man9glcnac2 alpha-13-glucosyltransferase-related [Anaeramoeba flamelloides]
MLVLDHHDYVSTATIIFQRISVLLMDVPLYLSIIHLKRYLNGKYGQVFTRGDLVLILLNPGLILVDNMHFQYNSLMLSILIFSISFAIRKKYLISLFLFCVVLNLKHIYLYYGICFAFYILKNYVFHNAINFLRDHNKNRKRKAEKEISMVLGNDIPQVFKWDLIFMRLFKIFVITFSVFSSSFYPFLRNEFDTQLSAILGRLFPFGRGLTHSYWAPNYWAIHTFVDKVLQVVTGKAGKTGFKTRGVVGDLDEHVILPTVTPLMTAVITLLALTPLIKVLIDTKSPSFLKTKIIFIESIAYAALSSFMFGWHVHEKAILMASIPLCLLASHSLFHAKISFILNIIGTFSLFPLLFTFTENVIKVCMLLTFASFSYHHMKSQHLNFSSFMQWYEKLYLILLIPFYLSIIIFRCLPIYEKLPFLPLLFISVYSAVGIGYVWLSLFFKVLSRFIDFDSSKKEK